MPKYIGATIGPIVDTILRSKKTRSAWRASYIFSYLMKNIIIKLREEEKKGKIKFILPYSNDETIYNTPQNAGLFHDRLIIEVIKDFSLAKLLDIKNEVFKSFVEKSIKNKYKNTKNENCVTGKKEFLEYMNDYMNFYMVERDIEKGKNIIFEISQDLDVLELQPKICLMQFEKDKNYLFDFINAEYKNNFLEEDAFGKDKNIDSLPEIAWKDIYLSLNDDNKIKKAIDDELKQGKNNPEYEDDEKSYKILAQNDKFRKHHKYYAVVRADGDGIGKNIEKLKTVEEYQEFSNNLFQFAIESVKKIENYGGLPVFAGGDDLLFFAPIINENPPKNKDDKNHINIFGLTTELSNIFENIFENKFEGKENIPTLSFGIAINYYKYPLYESLEQSADLLFGNAKNYNGKDATAIKLLKGGIKPIEFTFSKKNKVAFQNLLKNFLTEEKSLIKGIIYKLESQIEVLKIIQEDGNKIENFFKNNFKKKEHTTENNELNKEMKKIMEIVIDYGKNRKIEKVLKIFRFMMFLTEKGDTNE